MQEKDKGACNAKSRGISVLEADITNPNFRSGTHKTQLSHIHSLSLLFICFLQFKEKEKNERERERVVVCNA
jgi:hypothetical protein